jgi:hypothetical protein
MGRRPDGGRHASPGLSGRGFTCAEHQHAGAGAERRRAYGDGRGATGREVVLTAAA